jgi:hypothetical protein
VAGFHHLPNIEAGTLEAMRTQDFSKGDEAICESKEDS